MQLTVTVGHDEKEGVWFVESSDVPGLNAEAPTLDALVDVVANLVPDLVAANLPGTSATSQISLCVQHVMNARPANAA